jgi:hypothetical protein
MIPIGSGRAPAFPALSITHHPVGAPSFAAFAKGGISRRQHNDMPFRVSEPSLRSQPCGNARSEDRGIGSAVLQGQYNPVQARSSPCLCASVVKSSAQKKRGEPLHSPRLHGGSLILRSPLAGRCLRLLDRRSYLQHGPYRSVIKDQSPYGLRPFPGSTEPLV